MKPFTSDMSKTQAYLKQLCQTASKQLVVSLAVWNSTADDWVFEIVCQQCAVRYKAMESMCKAGTNLPWSLQEFIKGHAHPINAAVLAQMEKDFGKSNINSLGAPNAKVNNEAVTAFKQKFIDQYKETQAQKAVKDVTMADVLGTAKPLPKVIPLLKPIKWEPQTWQSKWKSEPIDLVQKKLEIMAKSLGLSVDQLLAQMKGETTPIPKPEPPIPKVAPEQKGRRIR